MPADTANELQPPSPWLLLMEGGRAPWEYAATLAAMPWLSRVPAGDSRRPVNGACRRAADGSAR